MFDLWFYHVLNELLDSGVLNKEQAAKQLAQPDEVFFKCWNKSLTVREAVDVYNGYQFLEDFPDA